MTDSRSLPIRVPILLACLTLSCDRKSSTALNTFKTVPITNLVADVRTFALQANADEWTWQGNDSRLPSTVRTLSPIRVTLRKETAPTIVEIKLSGGFLPHGLLVTCETNALYTNKLYGNGWEVQCIGDGIYEYRGY